MPPSKRISVALCTCNGERFLPGQLASILGQLRLPDEVVVCDDCSADGTVQILRAFADAAPFPVTVVVNETNLGVARNFEKAISLCSGELIAFSDQDDLWLPQRLELSERVFQQCDNVGLVFSNAELIDDHDRPLGKTLWQNYCFGPALQAKLRRGNYLPCVQLRFVTGATVMVRAKLAIRCLPAGEGWIHDEWLAAAVPLFADLRPLPELLISYRQHASQQIGATPQITFWGKFSSAIAGTFDLQAAETTSWGNLRMEAERTQTLCDRFKDQELSPEGTERLASYMGFVDWLLLRLRLPQSRLARIPTLVRHNAQFRRYARLRSAFKDLFLPKTA